MDQLIERVPLRLIVFGFVLLFTLWLGKKLLPALYKFKCDQPISGYLEEHKAKAGTPTMGGLFFAIPTLVAVLLVTLTVLKTDAPVQTVTSLAGILFLSLANAGIGLWDDVLKIQKRKAAMARGETEIHNEGLKVIPKLLLQFAASTLTVAFLALTGSIQTVMHVPFTSGVVDLGFWYYVISVILIVGFVNAVNLTDGIDGLASVMGLVCMAFLFFVGQKAGQLGLECSGLALGAGLTGFLAYNWHPAKVFMGDTGSLFIGAVLGGAAVLSGFLIEFLMLGLLFWLDMGTSVLQVAVYKLTKKQLPDGTFEGKRLFKKAPVHHLLQEIGWSEETVVLVFALGTFLLGLAAYFGIG